MGRQEIDRALDDMEEAIREAEFVVDEYIRRPANDPARTGLLDLYRKACQRRDEATQRLREAIERTVKS